MQYFNELTNAKRLNINKILSFPCRISIKEDGSAFQVMYDKEHNKLIFGKRSYSPLKVVKFLEETDLLNYSYYYAYIHLKKYEDIIKKYDILNFEIINNNDGHIINYEQNEISIILLSVYKNGIAINSKELQIISKQLHIDNIKYIECGYFPEILKNYVLNDKKDDDFLFDIIIKLYNIKKTNIEGFVLEFNDNGKYRYYKIQNPLFHYSLIEHLNSEHKNKEIDLEYLYTLIINNFIENNNINSTDTKIEKLFKVWEVSKNIINNKIDLSCNVIQNLNINLIFLQLNYEVLYKKYILANEKERLLFNFIFLGFLNKRTKNTLWCSIEYQKNVLNTFLEKYLLL